MSDPARALHHEMQELLPLPSLRRIMAAALAVLVLGLGGMLAWAAATPLDRAVIALGTVAAEGRRKTITLFEPGVLAALDVREGERVAAGQSLLRLDVTLAEAAAHQARAQVSAQLARLARLHAEQDDAAQLARPITLPHDATAEALLAAEIRLFAARLAAFEGALALSRARLAQLQEQAQANAAQRDATGTRLRALREELSGTQRLVAAGFATRTRLWELQRAEAELVGNLGQFAALEAAAREQMAQAELEIANLRLNRRQEVARELQDALAQLADAEQRLRGANDVLRRREVTAPEVGIVTDIRFFTPGSGIAAGQPVLDLVPLDDTLLVEARVPVADVEQVHVGQAASLRLSAFRTAEVPLLPGRVAYVSADRRTDERGVAFFLARVAFEMEALARSGATLAPGMPVEAYLLGERRTALDYVLRPLRDSLRRSLRD